MTDRDVIAALTDEQVLSLTLWGEARSEELEGRLAVGCVIRNRAADEKRWGDTIKDVCLEPWQFSCWKREGGIANHEAVMTLARKWTTGPQMTSSPLLLETVWLADGLMSGMVRDRVSGANHYVSRRLWETAPPAWAKDQRPTLFLGGHVFFRL